LAFATRRERQRAAILSREARWRFGDRQPGNDDGNKLGTLPGIEWAIVDTVNIQPEFPVATTRWKNEAHVARAIIDADERRFPQTSHRHQNWVFTLGSRAILEFPLGSGLLFSRTAS